MKELNQNSSYDNRNYLDDDIDLIGLLAKVIRKRRLVFQLTLIGLCVGLIIAFLTTSRYTASTIFIPQTGNERTSGNLSGLASLAGISLGSTSSGNDIPTTLYPKVVKSIPFKQSLLSMELFSQNSTGATSLRDYFVSKPESAVSKFKKYTVSLPGQIISALRNDVDKRIDIPNLETMGLKEQELLDLLDNIVSVNVNEKEGFVELRVSYEDPLIAAQIAFESQTQLQTKIIEYRVEHAKELLRFTEEQFFIKRIEMEAIQDSLADFLDQNQNISTSMAKNKRSRIEADFSIANSVFQELAKQVEQAKIQVSKNTPIFNIIEPVTIPNRKSEPNRILILVLWTFLGAVSALGYILLINPMYKIKEEVLKRTELSISDT